MSASVPTIGSPSPVSVVAHDGDQGSIAISDAHFLFHADFKRSGSDLTLTGEDGHRVVVPGYFKHEHSPALVAPNGAMVTADIVDALVGSIAPDQYAQAGAPAGGAAVIGKVASAQGNATVVRNGVSVTLNSGDAVLKGDVVQTGSDSAVGIILSDGATFNLDANARMVLNEFVYNPNGSSNSAGVTLVQGTINFLA